MQIYTRKEHSENNFEVLSADGTVLKNHNDKPYPHLSENISRNLITDLNHIASKYYDLPEEDSEDDEKESEVLFNNVLARISGEELRQSFAYCLLSTIIEYQEASVAVELEVELQMQWDRLFRMNIIPNGGELELAATQKARDYFGGQWANFGLNYGQSFEEMEEMDVKQVSDDLISKVEKLVEELHFSHKIAVNILYNFFDYFSITIPVLWVSGKINDEDFIASYYALQYGVNIFDLDEEAYEEPRFLMNRLLFLKTILWEYAWKGDTLSCNNY